MSNITITRNINNAKAPSIHNIIPKSILPVIKANTVHIKSLRIHKRYKINNKVLIESLLYLTLLAFVILF